MWDFKKKARKLETQIFTTHLLDMALTSLGLSLLHDRMNLQPAMVPATLMLEAPGLLSYRRLAGECRSSYDRDGSLLTFTVPSLPRLLIFLEHHSAVDRDNVETPGPYCSLLLSPLCSQPRRDGCKLPLSAI